MAKTSKDTTTSAAKNEAKIKAALADPITTKNLVRLLNIIALLLAITAFLLQFFAVITHHWKYQVTHLQPLFNTTQRVAPANIYDDSRIHQTYGLYSRKVKVYANNDEEFKVCASTRFPRLDNDDEKLHRCLSQTSTLRGTFLTCATGLQSPEDCHCRRYAHWNAVIFFEVTALVLLGLVVIIASLLTTQYHGLLKPIGVLLSLVAFLFLLIGLIIILSYLKRETRSFTDAYSHIHSRLSTQVGRRYTNARPAIVRRQAHETYRAYPLASGQHAYNGTHFQQWSQEQNKWIHIPYANNPANYAPRTQYSHHPTTTSAPLRNAYGPLIEYSRVYEDTDACIGWSTVLSILAMIIALLLPAVLAFSFLKAKPLGPDVRTVTTTTVKTEYLPGPHDVTVETVPLNRPVPTDNYGGRQEQVVVRDVVIRDEHPTTTQTYRT